MELEPAAPLRGWRGLITPLLRLCADQPGERRVGLICSSLIELIEPGRPRGAAAGGELTGRGLEYLSPTESSAEPFVWEGSSSVEAGGPARPGRGGRRRRSLLPARARSLCPSQLGLPPGVLGRRASASRPAAPRSAGAQGGNGSVDVLGASGAAASSPGPSLAPPRFLTARDTPAAVLLCCSLGTGAAGRFPFLSLSFLNRQPDGVIARPSPLPSAGSRAVCWGNVWDGADSRDGAPCGPGGDVGRCDTQTWAPWSRSPCASVSSAESQGSDTFRTLAVGSGRHDPGKPSARSLASPGPGDPVYSQRAGTCACPWSPTSENKARPASGQNLLCTAARPRPGCFPLVGGGGVGGRAGSGFSRRGVR